MNLTDDEAIGTIHDAAVLQLVNSSKDSDESTAMDQAANALEHTALSSRISTVENMLAVNTLRDSVDAGWTMLDMIDGIADEYEDETGVNGGSTTAIYDPTDNLYKTPSANNILQLQSETFDGDTTFVDTSEAFTITPINGTTHTTSQAKFGSSSIDLIGNNSLSLPVTPEMNIGTGDFTIQAWIRRPDVTGNRMLLNFGATGSNSFYVYLTGNNLRFHGYGGSGSSNNQATMSLVADTWHHLAISKESGTLRMFQDGVQIGIDMTDTKNISITGNCEIGAQDAGFNLDGYMEDFQFNMSEALYTEDFTPPGLLGPTSVGGVTVESESFTADTQPEFARLVILHEPSEVTSLNTDIKVFVSRDGGANFTDLEGVLALDGVFLLDVDILTTDDIDLGSLPIGSEVVYKIETFNGVSQKIHGAWLQWR